MKRNRLMPIMLVLSISGCATQIHNRDETILPSPVPLGTFSSVYIKPLVNNSKSDFPAKAEDLVTGELHKCLGQQFASKLTNDPNSQLILEPTIVKGKYVTSTDRILWGASAGGSAVLLEIRVSSKDGKIVDPIFYSSVSAWRSSMSYTFGGADEDAIANVADVACDYVRRNM